MRVMLIEDNDETAEFVGRGLREAGWAVDRYAAAAPALLALPAGQYDALILDRMLPGMDGIDALKLARGAGLAVPVLMLTARGGLDDRVAGLEAGADDYLPKPFAMSELIARLRAIARRPALAPESTTIAVADLSLDRMTREARRAGQLLDLSPLEFKLLECLLRHEGAVVTRTMLLEQVWGYSFDPKTSLVQTHMSRLRAKVDKPFERDLIRTVRGSGYVLAAL